MIYATYYRSGDSRFGSEIEADDAGHARQLCIARGLGERLDDVMPYERAASNNCLLEMTADRDAADWDSVLHQATFLCYVGLASGALTPRETLGDTGLVHEILHYREDPRGVWSDELFLAIRMMAKDFQGRVPGWPTRFGGSVQELAA